ncbi:NAD-dependent epimerase/dehydratase family protein [Candidatus Woesearchaeota archaeon]|nr:NAD-dependent epimerase/dehydratase family protein [Candidatus Woesearchaeota archaeon]
MKVFVTGGAGFIGSHVVSAIIDAGHSVTVFDDLSTGYEEYVDKRASFIKGDLANVEFLKNAVNGNDAVVHLASENNIADSVARPDYVLKRNVNNAINLLECMRLNNINKLVFSSSSSVYGENKKGLVREDSPKRPLQPYGASKLAVESVIYGHHFAFGINSVILRFFNVYGPRDDQLPVTRAIPTWVKSIILGKAVPIFWGGKQIRDYIFVKDVARAVVFALEKCDSIHEFNVGSGFALTMKQILDEVFAVAGKNVPVKDAGERKGDPPRLIADISSIKDVLGWSPLTGLKEGLKMTYDFYSTHPESLRRL